MPIFTIKLKPGSKKPRANVTEQGIELAIRARPVNGQANAALVEILAKALGMPKSKIQIVKGHTSRLKQISIDVDGTKLNEVSLMESVRKVL